MTTGDSPTVTLVVNPAASSGRAKAQLPNVVTTLLSSLPGINLRVFQSTSFADARLRCGQAVANARPGLPGQLADSLLVMGGDGIMHLGLNACAETSVPLGLIPAGRGNDFCRGAGVPTDIFRALKVIAAGHTEDVDLMRVTGDLADGAAKRYVGSILSSGFDARVNARVNRMSHNMGQFSYTWASLAELSIFEPIPYRLNIDGEQLDLTAMFVCVGNAGYFGGGMKGLPHFDISDGMLDVTIIHPVSRLTFARLLPRMFSGKFSLDPAIEMLRAKEVIVDGDGLLAMADGEDLGRIPITCSAAPGALRLYRPEQ
ncbi:MAG: diacylglycerol kinase family lipid kinase [Propionibacteriaceae bacterium]|jgi:diacylglycerol kinase (ATP)|nr:diacylglycerol kinase family lipid kinase [Propionibacteriaceae bacterium]